ncbi:MAG: CBS domain-containing protein [Limibaculum sp.]
MFDKVDYTALGVAVAVFLIAAFIAWIIKRLNITDGVGFIALVVLPLAAYGVASGYVSEITTPGGWGAKFREVAGARIEPAPLADEIEDLMIIEKGGVSAIQRYRENLTPGRPIALTLQLGRSGYYNQRAIATYIRAFLTFDPMLTVVFEEGQRRFAGSSNGNSVLAALELDDNRRLLGAIEDADLLKLKDLIVLTTNFVTPVTTNSEALNMMLRDGVDAIVAVDDQRRATGIVRRDEIVSRLMVKLASD